MAKNPNYDQIVNAIKAAKNDEEIMRSLKQAGLGSMVFNSYIRCDTAIKNSDEMKFVILDQATASNTLNDSERRLAIQNIFVATSIGFHLKAVTSTVGHVAAVKHTYPNLTVFPNGTTSLNSDLEAIYQSGYIEWKTNSTVFMPNIQLAQHRIVPMWPKGQEITYVTTGPRTGVIERSPSKPSDGFVKLPGKMVIDGGVPQEIRMIVPGGSGLKMKYDVAGTDFFGVLELRGIEVQGVGK